MTIEVPQGNNDARNSAAICSTIRQRIINGDIAGGDRLKLAQLASEFGVSLTPVREALWRLEGEGLVEVLSNRGAVVSTIDEAFIENVYDIRAALESALVEKMISSVTASDLTSIEEKMIAFEASTINGNIGDILEADSDFHRTINYIAGNDLALKNLASSARLIRPLRRRIGFTKQRLSEIRAEHRSIFTAISEGDSRKAGQMARLHANGAKRDLLAAMNAVQPVG